VWYPSNSPVLERTVELKRPVVLYFVEKDTEAARAGVSGDKLSGYSLDKALFIIVPKAGGDPAGPAQSSPVVTGKERDKSAGADVAAAEQPKSVVPTMLLSSSDLWKAYGIKDAGTLVVADWFGNTQTTFASFSREGAVVTAIDDIPNQVEKDAQRLGAEFKKVQAALEKGSDPTALKSILKMFKDGKVGHDSMNSAIEEYRKIETRGRDKLKELEAAGDVKALRKWGADFKGSDLDRDIEAAAKRLKTKA
jgi:hypothetical protein